MKTQGSVTAPGSELPDAASLAALRAWYEGLSSREAVDRFIADRRGPGQSSRGLLGRVRQQVIDLARSRQREDVVALLRDSRSRNARRGAAIARALETLRSMPVREPLIGDEIERWLPPRVVRSLRAAGIKTLADLTVRVPRRRRWWADIAGLGAAGARHVEAFFAGHPKLTHAAQALVAIAPPENIAPWERIVVPHEVDGSKGTFRAPRASCTLRADNDYAAVQAWLSLHESAQTQRTYRKEAERLLLWAIVERGRALSSLSTEDAVAYRAFLRRPTPRSRWLGPSRPRISPEWRPFARGLSARSTAHALSVLGAMFRWLLEQRYVLANPFSGIKVRGARPAGLDTSRVFSEGEWALLRTVADGLEWSYGWSSAAAQRLRFLLDFAYATGLRAGELVGATLGAIEVNAEGSKWLHVIGKGGKPGKVTLPPLASSALDRYLVQRGLSTTPAQWGPTTPIIASLQGESSITTTRLWAFVKRFFATAAEIVGDGSPAAAEKLRRATPHWMRHSHATHALERGAELTSVRDNLRHASVSTTSMYLHADDRRRERQMAAAFGVREG